VADSLADVRAPERRCNMYVYGTTQGQCSSVTLHAGMAHQAAGLAFRRLRGADDAPLRVVQVARLGELALAPNRRVDAPQVTQRRCICQPIEHLQFSGPVRNKNACQQQDSHQMLGKSYGRGERHITGRRNQ